MMTNLLRVIETETGRIADPKKRTKNPRVGGSIPPLATIQRVEPIYITYRAGLMRLWPVLFR